MQMCDGVRVTGERNERCEETGGKRGRSCRNDQREQLGGNEIDDWRQRLCNLVFVCVLFAIVIVLS